MGSSIWTRHSSSEVEFSIFAISSKPDLKCCTPGQETYAYANVLSECCPQCCPQRCTELGYYRQAIFNLRLFNGSNKFYLTAQLREILWQASNVECTVRHAPQVWCCTAATLLRTNQHQNPSYKSWLTPNCDYVDAHLNVTDPSYECLTNL